MGPAVLGGCAWPWPPIPQSHRKALSALDFFGVTSPEKNPSKGKRMGVCAGKRGGHNRVCFVHCDKHLGFLFWKV